MDIAALGTAVQGLFAQGLASSTTRTYNSAKRRYLDFCRRANLSPLPLTQTSVSLFAAFLWQQGLRPQSITVYLAALRHLQIADSWSGLPRSEWPYLQYVLRGIKRSGSRSAPSQHRLPITASIMRVLRSVWVPLALDQNYESCLLWAAVSLAFFGFLRSGEVTSQPGVPPTISWSSLAINAHTDPSVLKVQLHRSKTDQFGKGVPIYVGKTGNDLCPIGAVLSYLAVRPPIHTGPLFIHQDGSPLSRDYFVKSMKEALRSRNVDYTSYSGHSFRIGAASAAARAGVPDHLIKAMGRWQSEAYQVYIHTPPETLASISAALATS